MNGAAFVYTKGLVDLCGRYPRPRVNNGPLFITVWAAEPQSHSAKTQQENCRNSVSHQPFWMIPSPKCTVRHGFRVRISNDNLENACIRSARPPGVRGSPGRSPGGFPGGSPGGSCWEIPRYPGGIPWGDPLGVSSWGIPLADPLGGSPGGDLLGDPLEDPPGEPPWGIWDTSGGSSWWIPPGGSFGGIPLRGSPWGDLLGQAPGGSPGPWGDLVGGSLGWTPWGMPWRGSSSGIFLGGPPGGFHGGISSGVPWGVLLGDTLEGSPGGMPWGDFPGEYPWWNPKGD